MKNFSKIDTMVVPYYEQFKEIGELFEDESIDYKFLNNARRFFSKQYFFELRLIIRAENRHIKRDFKKVKKAEQLKINKERKAEKQLKKQAKQKNKKELKALKKLQKQAKQKKPHVA